MFCQKLSILVFQIVFINCHSCFSLKYGTFTIEKLVEEAKAHGAATLALTDINNTSATFDFIRTCTEQGIRPVVGLEFRNGDRLCFIGLAKNRAGFRELNEWYARYRHTKADFPETAPGFNHVFVIYPLANKPAAELRENEYLGVQPADVGRLIRPEYKNAQDRMVIWQPVTFSGKRGYNLHRLLRAIDHNTLLSKLQAHQQAQPSETMMDTGSLLGYFKSYPRIIYNTIQLLDSCHIDFDLDANKNRKTFTGSRADDRVLLEKLAADGVRYRYRGKNKEAEARVARELDIIDRMGFSAYYLITWDIVRYAQNRGFYHVGRGSGANSIVAYCLGITDVDPIELDLYFERFLNIYRDSPPDFDIDFSWRDRDEVTDYIFKRYGRQHTALMATYVTFQGRNTLRELGKVFGLPKTEIDEIVKYPGLNRKRDHISKLMFSYGQDMEDMPSHLSIHAGGILITEEPMHSYTATDIPPKGFPITHFDMFVAEENGFYKYDILSQRGLGHIRTAIELVHRNRGRHIDIHDVKSFKRDPKLNDKLAVGDSIGCFYIESPAMRQLLTKLQCRDYVTLVAASSIIRPGVARSGMMREYIHRFHHPDDFEYLHPKMEELLKETYGVMVYQEDVIKVAHHFAGISLAEADVLRRGMSGKRRSKGEIEKIRDRFFGNCRERGIDEAITAEVWRQIESFSGYSFSKAHSASFAVESYQSLFLKTYYPYEFMVAVINNFGGFYNTEFYMREAQRSGATIHAPCVNHSEYLTTIYGDDIYLGFIHLNELEHKLGKTIPEERERAGPFAGLADFVDRIPVSKEQLNILIRIGAFRFIDKPRKALLWDAQMLLGHEVVPAGSKPMFQPSVREFRLPPLVEKDYERAFEEVELLGFPVCNPFDLLADAPKGIIHVDDMMSHVGKRVKMLGNLNAVKKVRTVKRDLMYFGGFWDSRLKLFDTVHFPDVARQYPFAGPGFYLLHGTVTQEFGVPSLDVQRMEKVPWMQDPRMGA